MMKCTSISRIAAMTLPLLLAAAPAHAQQRALPSASQLAARDSAHLTQFARKAAMAKEVGATEINVTEDLPIAMWELDPDDPYPA